MLLVWLDRVSDNAACAVKSLSWFSVDNGIAAEVGVDVEGEDEGDSDTRGVEWKLLLSIISNLLVLVAASASSGLTSMTMGEDITRIIKENVIVNLDVARNPKVFLNLGINEPIVIVQYMIGCFRPNVELVGYDAPIYVILIT